VTTLGWLYPLSRVYGYAWPLWHPGGDMYANEEAARVGERLARLHTLVHGKVEPEATKRLYGDSFRTGVSMAWGYYLTGYHWVDDPSLEPHEELAFRACLIPSSLADIDQAPFFRLLPDGVRAVCQADYYRKHSPAPVLPRELKEALEAFTGIAIPSGWDCGGGKVEHRDAGKSLATLIRRATAAASRE